MPDIARDYLRDVAELREFFHGGPPALFQRPSPASWQGDMREAIGEYQSKLGLTREIGETGAVIITGQQPGVLTGPLYTIYKAMTAIRLARDYTEKTGQRCHPVFWVGADDHDFDEVRTAHILTKNHQDLALDFRPETDFENRAMYRIPAEASLHELIEQAAANAPGSEFREAIERFLHTSVDDSESIADWFAHIMARLFRDTPLLIFMTSLPAARTAAIPIFEKEIAGPLASTRLLNDAGKKLEALGYTPQVVKADDECGFYLEFDTRRCKVLFRDGRFQVPEAKSDFSANELLSMLRAEPARFTANVVLRPIVQQALFPVVAYVAGPGEIAYWAQFKALFAHFEQPMPVVYPRSNAVLGSIKLNKLLKKFGLGIADLNAPQDELLEAALRQSVKNPGLDLLARERAALVTQAGAFASAFANLKGKDRAPAEQAKAVREQIEAGLDRMERTLLHADAAQTDAVRAQVERLSTALAPQRKPQERHYSIFSWLFEYGWDLIPRIMQELDVHSFTMNEIEL